MKYSELIKNHLQSSADIKKAMVVKCLADIERASLLAADALRGNGKILLCGNGGSAADSQHIATELVVRLSSDLNRRALPALALTTNTSSLTAVANDYGLEYMFSRQVEAFGAEGDVLIGISTSGNSGNVIKAVEKAREMKLKVIGFLGGSGGSLKDVVDIAIVVPHDFTGRIQEGHITVGHIMCDIIEKELF